ncbi:glycosyltransferase [Candidatus Woesebacteria bacterium]|nr:glycosyltransferase [Candidatus Woesebacteria bacterium]
MLNKPRFFIVTPSFNQAQFIEQTIVSILNQEECYVTLLVMDGGSSDSTRTILKKFGKEPNFFWVSEKDEGQSDALNKGIKAIKKHKPKSIDIFAYLNSDDYYLPHALVEVVRGFTQHPRANWLVADAIIVNEHGAEIQRPIRMYKRFWRKLLSAPVLSILNPIPQPATFIRYSALQKTGLFNQKLRYTMDYEYWHRLFQSVGRPLVISLPLAAFRIHEASKGGSQFKKQFTEELEVSQQFTNNSTLLSLHKLHNLLITGIYKIIKSF